MRSRRLSKRFSIYTVPSSFLSNRLAFLLLFLEVWIGVAGFMVIEGFNLIEAFYMTIITISTVGFAEVQPLSENGRLFVSIFILTNVGVFAYILAVFSYYVIQGEIFKKMHANLISTNIKRLRNHVILCGYGKYGREVTTHFLKHNISFVIIDKDPQKIEEIQKSKEKILYLEDDATHDEALLNAGIKHAAALISALPDDSDNVFVVLSARQLNPEVDIISRAKDPKSVKKLEMAGASHVVMPEQIGGFYMATLISKPGAVEFFSYITNEARSDIGFEEILYEDLPLHCIGKTIKELNIRGATGANIIGHKTPDGHYHVNPAPGVKLVPGASFIVLGDEHQLKELKDYLKHFAEQT